MVSIGISIYYYSMPQALEADQATLDMLDGLPPVDPEFWDKQGAQIRGISLGNLRNVAGRGATITTSDGLITEFPAPVQPQIVVKVENGVLLTERYDLKLHREAMDIPPMETTPVELEDQLFGDSGDRLVTEGQQLRNVRRKGTTRKKWPADYHPPVRRR